LAMRETTGELDDTTMVVTAASSVINGRGNYTWPILFDVTAYQ